MRRALLAVALLCWSLPSLSDYSQSDQAPALLKTLKQDYGFSEADLDKVRTALTQAQRLPQLVQQEQKAPERTENWTQYSRRIDDSRIHNGVRVIDQYATYFARAEEQFGVPAPVIAGIMGVETRYGRITGKVRVLDALATQGFDHPTRTRFFMSELVQFFVFCRDFGYEPTEPQGSYAGAMGAAQFMPSNYRRLALDYDGDGHRDLWTMPDAIGSIANYFANFRPALAWKRGEPLIVRARLNDGVPDKIELNGHTAAYTVAELARVGVVPETPLPPNTRVGLIELPLDDGKEYWLGLHNFYTVMTYNPRTFYAMAVSQLAQRITAQMDAPP
jgi:membrane-bound lytic murein transglycosylase B